MSDYVAKRARMEGFNVNEVQRKSTSPKKDVCDLGTQKFCEIVDVEAFVDKTLFIKDFLETRHKVIATLAPRRFGKSTLMDMVIEFVSGNKKLFQDNNLKIWKEDRVFVDTNCQENPIIHLDFKKINGKTVDEILEALKALISEAFDAHIYLINEVEGNYSWSRPEMEKVVRIEKFRRYWAEPCSFTATDITDGLMELCYLLHVYHGKPVYVFVDEYDHPIMGIILNPHLGEKDVYDIIKIIGDLMSSLFKGNDHMKKGLIMACVRIAEVLSGNANNILFIEFLKEPDFSPYFGFTAEEVDSLLNKDEFIPFKNDQVKEWYNGYTSKNSKDPLTVYSCISVITYLWKSKCSNKPRLEKYWINSGTITYVEELFAEHKIWKLIYRLIHNEEVEISTITRFEKKHILTLQGLVHQKPRKVDDKIANLFLLFLTEHGYLNVVSYDDGKETCIIQSPNMEINGFLRGKCYDADLIKKQYNISLENAEEYVKALKSLLQKTEKKEFIAFAKAVNQLFEGTVMPKNEDELHCILFVLAYNDPEFAVVRSELGVERQKPTGRPPHLNILMILALVGLIIEFKFESKSSGAGLQQIKENRYETGFDNDVVEKKILMGLHMTSKRKVSLTYSVDGSPEETVTSDD